MLQVPVPLRSAPLRSTNNAQDYVRITAAFETRLNRADVALYT